MNSQRDPNEGRRLDGVVIFGGKLTFLIPHDWVENEDAAGEDYYSYSEPNALSGWLRASLISMQGVADPKQRLESAFADRPFEVDNETGNYVACWTKDTLQDGEALQIHYWKVGRIVPPDTVREAIFSYTATASAANSDVTLRDIKLLSMLVRKAKLS